MGLFQNLASRDPAAFGGRGGIYRKSKYRGTTWTLLLLAELDASGSDDRVRDACEFILQHSQHREVEVSPIRALLQRVEKVAVLSCLTANMVFALSKLGFHRDERVINASIWLDSHMKYELDACKRKEWPYHRDSCWSPRTCRSSAVKCLKAMKSLMRAHDAPVDLDDSVRECSDYILLLR